MPNSVSTPTNNFEEQVNTFTNKILESPSLKKLIVAGPGTGKTSLFRKLIDHIGGEKKDFLILTFINNLEKELEKDLGAVSSVHTFHGYCHFLLRRYINLSCGLQNDFEYYPPLVKLISSDWEMSNNSAPPEFVNSMRKLEGTQNLRFYLERGNYYNAVSYDDSIYRVYKAMLEGAGFNLKYKQIIVDEYQDFDLLETEVLAKVSEASPILIAGDDDQALYCDLRGSNPDYIRKLFMGVAYEKFELPFCFRSTPAVVMFFNKFLDISKDKGFLKGRVDKRFLPTPTKERDNLKYPTIKLVVSTVQNKKSGMNYFGRYITGELGKITPEDIKESHDKEFPTVLIIGPRYYLASVGTYLDERGILYETAESAETMQVSLEDGLEIIRKDNNSNLGWRIILETERPDFYKEAIRLIITNEADLSSSIPKKFREEFMEKSQKYKKPEEPKEEKKQDISKPKIKLTTFEGAKGQSAQFVFIIGLQNGLLPRNPKNIRDIDISKFLVALTRTRKQCYFLATHRFAGLPTQISEFIKWSAEEKIPELEIIKVDKDFWNPSVKIISKP